MSDDPNMTVGDVTSVNLTVVSGGDENNANVVPSAVTVKFDIRLAVGMSVEAMDDEVSILLCCVCLCVQYLD